MFEEKLAILCNEKRQLIDDMRTRCPSHRFYKFKRNLSDFLFRGGACEGLNAMFVDLIFWTSCRLVLVWNIAFERVCTSLPLLIGHQHQGILLIV